MPFFLTDIKNSKNIKLFGFVVLILSILNLRDMTTGIHWASFLNSLLGIIGAIFYMRNKKWSANLLLFWAVSQIVIIEPYWNSAQVYNLGFETQFKMRNQSNFSIQLNILGIVYLGYVKLVLLNNLIGSEISLKPFRTDSFLHSILPAAFNIDRIVQLDDEKDWFLLKEINTDSPIYGLVKPKDKVKLKPNETGQILLYRAVENIGDVKDKNSKEDFKTGDIVVSMK